ncbi:MAG: class I SAM-dependent methyltransferase [Alphaproteobacteria bacterium]|nr:class I SAM-dependent methyltransferase [Alphaproteobacteria bacterium]
MNDPRLHWDEIYHLKSETEVSWFQEAPEQSLALISRAALQGEASVIDIGGGASRLADVLLRSGYGDLAVLDVSEAALARTKTRLGTNADRVRWIAADITKWRPDRKWQIWHDRAVFHFLTDTTRQDAYISALSHATEPGATAIIATFALNGPERCSGFPVQRYSSETLATRLGPRFRLVDQHLESHITPNGAVQQFQYAVLLRI